MRRPVPHLLLAEWVAGDLPPEAVPQYATDALGRGCDMPTLRRLAGETAPFTRDDIDSLVRQCITELGLEVPTPGEARAFAIDQWAAAIADRQIEPYVGARRIARLRDECWGSKEWERTGIFAGLASGWEDDPQRRPAYEAQIVSEAETLVGQGGLRGPRTALGPDDPLARRATEVIRSGDAAALTALLREHPTLARARIGDARRGQARTLLHVLTDWPGHFPDAAGKVAALVAAGADVNARFTGTHTETPLHWAASSDDIDALDALLDAGADIEADGAVIAGGTPMADAVAFGQWRAARRLLERGAGTNLWQAAALGLADRVRDELAASPPPAREDLDDALWCAAHGGQRETAELLLARGADPARIGYDDLTAAQAAERSGAHELAAWLARQPPR